MSAQDTAHAAPGVKPMPSSELPRGRDAPVRGECQCSVCWSAGGASGQRCPTCRRGRWRGKVCCREAGVAGTWGHVGALLGAGRGQFTAALEVVESERLVMSFLHHMALQRQCRNPFEKGDIAGITNYLDVGLQVLSGL